MAPITTDGVITLLSTIVTLIGVLTGMYFFARRYPLEKQTAAAEAKQDLAAADNTTIQAQGTFLANYNALFNMVLERDQHVIRLNLAQTESEAKIEKLTLTINTLSEDLEKATQRATALQRKVDEGNIRLDEETRRRIQAEDRLEETEAQIISLTNEVQSLKTNKRPSRRKITQEVPQVS